MIKKILAVLSTIAVLSTLIVPTAFADFSADLIDTVTLTVDKSSPQLFEPSAGQVLNVAVAYQSGVTALKTTGSIVVKKGDVVVKTLHDWKDEEPKTGPFTWDGKSSDSAQSARDACADTGKACADGNYNVVTHIEHGATGSKAFDDKISAFKIYTTPEIAVTNLAVTNAAQFNPAVQGETADISYTLSNEGFVTVQVVDALGVVQRTVVNNVSETAGAHSKTTNANLAWNGQDKDNKLVQTGDYKVEVLTRKTSAGLVLDKQSVDIKVEVPATILIQEFNLSPNPVDFSENGKDEDLEIKFTLNKLADTVNIQIQDEDGDELKNFQSTALTETFSWNGDFATELVEPGNYKVRIEVKKSGEATVTQEKPFSVSYPNSQKGLITNFTVSPDVFSPNNGTDINFTTTESAEVTVEVRDKNDGLVKSYTSHNDTDHPADTDHTLVWNGDNNAGNDVSDDPYTIKVVTRNKFGVVVEEKQVTVQKTTNIPESNSHIAGIDLSPSKTFKPGSEDDEELTIEFDVEEDLEDLVVFAVRGSIETEIEDFGDIDKENNVETSWDGTIDEDEDDYASAGDWRIEFRSTRDGIDRIAAKEIEVKYDKPIIDDIEISKDDFDPNEGEFTHVLFKVDEDADVDIFLYDDGSEDEEIVEDLEVEANKWYAVEYDGSGKDEDDKDLELWVFAKNKANDTVFDLEKINIDLDDDSEVSSSKSNVTEDYISPVITDGKEDMTVFFRLDEDADVVVSIHKGLSKSGTKQIELIDVEDMQSGDYELEWDGLDEDGDKLSKGFYTYKIESKKKSTETEFGHFYVGVVGDIDGTASGSGSSSSNNDNNNNSNNSGSISPNVTIGGSGASNNDDDDDDEPFVPPTNNTQVFPDVSTSSKYFDAVDWAYEEGIFQGYADGTFRPHQAINRVEVLKVVLEAMGVNVFASDGTTQGFSDVNANDWYMPYIRTGKALGIFSGDAGKTTARPGDVVNRAEALKFAFETLKVAENHSVSFCGFSPYPDVTGSDWFVNYVCQSNQFGLFDSFDGVNFTPGALSSRGEVALMLFRMNQADLF